MASQESVGFVGLLGLIGHGIAANILKAAIRCA